jgi:hypothetical protein
MKTIARSLAIAVILVSGAAFLHADAPAATSPTAAAAPAKKAHAKKHTMKKHHAKKAVATPVATATTK